MVSVFLRDVTGHLLFRVPMIDGPGLTGQQCRLLCAFRTAKTNLREALKHA